MVTSFEIPNVSMVTLHGKFTTGRTGHTGVFFPLEKDASRENASYNHK